LICSPLGLSLKLRPGGIVGLIIGRAREEFVQLVNSVPNHYI